MILVDDSFRKNFSVAFAVFGVFGYFFHRSQMKGTGLFWLVIALMIAIKILSPIHPMLPVLVCGILGGRFVNTRVMSKPDFDEELFYRREKIAGIMGLVMWGIFMFI